MRHTFQAQFVVVFLSLAAALSANQRLFAAEPASPAAAKRAAPATAERFFSPTADPWSSLIAPATQASPSVGANPWLSLIAPPPAAAKPAPQSAAATLEKLKNIGSLLGRALDLAVHLMSGNEADMLSKNSTALLSGNKPEVLSGNNT